MDNTLFNTAKESAVKKEAKARLQDCLHVGYFGPAKEERRMYLTYLFKDKRLKYEVEVLGKQSFYFDDIDSAIDKLIENVDTIVTVAV